MLNYWFNTKRPAGIERVLGSAYNDYNLVIALENGNPVESRIVRDRFTTLCEEHNFEVVVFHSLRHLSTKYKLKMTHGDIKSVQGDTGHAEAEMVTDVYSEIVDEDRRLNAKSWMKNFMTPLIQRNLNTISIQKHRSLSVTMTNFCLNC